MKETLIEMIESLNPKSLSQAVMRKKDLHDWVLKSTSYLNDTCTLAERIYNVINGPSERICKNGNTKKFRDMKYGYMFCGRAAKCACNKENVSQKVIEAKKNLSREEIEASNKKREETNLRTRGVTNAGQTEQAKKAHAEFYSKPENVTNAVHKQQETLYRERGVRNAAYLSDLRERRAKNNPKLKIDIDQDLLNDKEWFTEQFNACDSMAELADLLGVHVLTASRFAHQHGLKEKYRSVEESSVVRFIESLGFKNILTNTKSVLKTHELDIYLPEQNIAIEYNGYYWHSDKFCGMNYHKEKFKRCEEQGIHLITLFSNLWLNKNELVKSRLRHKLGCETEKVHARKCAVVKVTPGTAKDFLERYHIQGNVGFCKHYGLEHDGELVAVMSIKTLAKTEPKEYELARYATSSHVAGGAGKLFKHFIREQNPQKVISYSDNAWNQGKIYEKLGFEFLRETKPGYWYIAQNGLEFIHRRNFWKSNRKKLGLDENKPEKEVAEEAGFYKIWDCGHKVWVWNNNGSIPKECEIPIKEFIQKKPEIVDPPEKKQAIKPSPKPRIPKRKQSVDILPSDPIEEIKRIIKTSPSQSVVRVASSRQHLWKTVEKYCEQYTFKKKSEMIYVFANQMTPPICKCGSNLRLPFNNIIDGYRAFCGLSCELKTKGRMESQADKGGVGFAKDWVRKKAKETLIKNQGVENPGQLSSRRKSSEIKS